MGGYLEKPGLELNEVPECFDNTVSTTSIPGMTWKEMLTNIVKQENNFIRLCCPKHNENEREEDVKIFMIAYRRGNHLICPSCEEEELIEQRKN